MHSKLAAHRQPASFFNLFSEAPIYQDRPTNQLNVYHEAHTSFSSHDNCGHHRNVFANAWSGPVGDKVGTLNCQLAPGVGFIIGSHQPMRCRYTPDRQFPLALYDGVINSIGLDIGF
jgi:hypothetical protein